MDARDSALMRPAGSRHEVENRRGDSLVSKNARGVFKLETNGSRTEERADYALCWSQAQFPNDLRAARIPLTCDVLKYHGFNVIWR